MVAEPVHATLDALNYAYSATSRFLSNASEKITKEFEGFAWFAPDTTTRMPVGDPEASTFRFPPYKIALSLLSIGIGAGSVYVWHRARKAGKVRPLKPKRRVPKLANGARQDVVLLVGSPTEPFTRLIALDFERRGFVVYLTILDEKDFRYIESNPITEDMNYLNLTDTITFENQISKFSALLKIPVIPFPGADSHNLKLVGVVFTPRFHFPVSPVENVSAASWVLVNDKFLTYVKLFASGLIGLIRNQNSKIIAIIPSITPSLNLPYHSTESVFQNSLLSFFTTLSQEVSQHGLSVTQVKLGNIFVAPNGSNKSFVSVDSEIRSWNEDMKDLYSKSFLKSQRRANPLRSTGRGAHLRDLYHLLFDLIYSKHKNPPVVYCGTGARSYDWLAGFLPQSVIQWILV